MVLEAIIFKQDYRCFKKGFALNFNRHINLLVGDQGSGKSTILSFLSNSVDGFNKTKYDRSRESKIVDIICPSEMVSYSMDFEKDNPRNLVDSDKFTGQVKISARWSSHGQANLAVLKCMSKDKVKPNTIFIMDEPDMALSIKTCLKLAKIFDHVIKQGAQIVAAVHNPMLISQFHAVYSLEHRRWMPSKEFIELHVKEGKEFNIQ